MKNLLVVLLLISASAVGSAASFKNFVGRYSPSSKPLIALKGMNYCDAYGFSGVRVIEIVSKNGEYVADISSELNNSTVHSYLTFREYSYSANNVKDTAKIISDEHGTRYVVTSQTALAGEVSEWLMSKGAQDFHLRMTTRSVNLGLTTASCVYDVDLKKQN